MLNSAKTLPGRLRPVIDEQEFARQTRAEILDGVLDVAKSATRIAFFKISPPTYSSFTAQQQLLFRFPNADAVRIEV